MKTHILFFLTIIPFFLFSQNKYTQVYGVVEDDATLKGLNGVKVSITKPITTPVYTDPDGVFTINNLEKSDDYEIKLELDGYRTNVIPRFYISSDNMDKKKYIGKFNLINNDAWGFTLVVEDSKTRDRIDAEYYFNNNPNNDVFKISKQKFISIEPNINDVYINISKTGYLPINSYHVKLPITSSVVLPLKKLPTEKEILNTENQISHIDWKSNDENAIYKGKEIIISVIEWEYELGRNNMVQIFENINKNEALKAVYFEQKYFFLMKIINNKTLEYQEYDNKFGAVNQNIQQMDENDFISRKNDLKIKIDSILKPMKSILIEQINLCDSIISNLNQAHSLSIFNGKSEKLNEITMTKESIYDNKKKFQQYLESIIIYTIDGFRRSLDK